MAKTDIILASKSPRRRELLHNIGLEFSVCPSLSEEPAPEGVDPGAAVEHIAAAKAREVAARNPASLVIGADTLVYLDGQPIGKPRDGAQAREMLRRLSGRRHTVYTGVCIVAGGREKTAHAATDVYFKELTDAEIAGYVASGEPLDKAGAYGAQGLGALIVQRIDGDFFNVMGLPLRLTAEMLKDFGVSVL